ncbi:MAG TPA: tRNA pseudouridine(55) synthase TruB [Actinomycetes bacterium]|nr:tRNA pseudouridine(55) synthase TruB [Actinomycetes bacterium]
MSSRPTTTQGPIAPDGIVIVDKPAGVTSHDVVARMRRLANTRKVGHAGTLDPMATGVLVIGIGRATRLLGYVAATDKAYDATVRLGESTVTDDAEGEVVSTKSASAVDESDVRKHVQPLVGEIQQIPSSVSAIKVAGERAYARVREGKQVDLAPRTVVVSSLDTLRFARPTVDLVDVDISVVCSTGTYVRALARDLGESLGVGGHLTALRRTRVGSFGVQRARSLERLADELEVIPPGEVAAACFPTLTVDTDIAQAVGHGKPQPIPSELTDPGVVAVLTESGTLVALMGPRDGMLRVLAGFTG